MNVHMYIRTRMYSSSFGDIYNLALLKLKYKNLCAYHIKTAYHSAKLML